MAKKMPVQVFVVWEKPENDDPFLSVHLHAESAIDAAEQGDSDGKVGVYSLKAVRAACVRRTLE